jgi:hypothetical protein
LKEVGICYGHFLIIFWKSKSADELGGVLVMSSWCVRENEKAKRCNS